MNRFNDWLGLKITNVVATMWCAYIFAALSFVSLPAAIASHNVVTIVSWIAQTFLQLVLLSIILVGQKLQSQDTQDLHDKMDKVHKHLGIK